MGQKRNVENLLEFAKEHFATDLDLDDLEKKLDRKKEEQDILGVYYQIDQYIKDKTKKVLLVRLEFTRM